MFDTTLAGAFIAGLFSFISPCILPLIPPYLCFITGLSLDQVTGEKQADGAKRTVFLSAIAFVLGFSAVFILMGASASYVGQLLSDYFSWLSIAAGIIIIIMGLHFLGIFKISLLYKQAKVEVQRKPAGIMGSFLVGLAFAFGWSPCAGPVLAAILTVAGAEDSVMRGAVLLGAYSLGIGIPFLLAAAFAAQFIGFMRKFSKHMGIVEKIMGALLVITGLLIATGKFSDIGIWMQQTFGI